MKYISRNDADPSKTDCTITADPWPCKVKKCRGIVCKKSRCENNKCVPGPHPKKICRGKSEGDDCDKICAENYLDNGICVNIKGKCNSGVCKFDYSELSKVSVGGKKPEIAPVTEAPSPPSGKKKPRNGKKNPRRKKNKKSVGYGY